MLFLPRTQVAPRALDPEFKKLYDLLVGVTNAVTASTSSDQAGAVPIVTPITVVTTVGTGGDSVRLPKAYAGMALIVKNAAAANSMDVFPASGDKVNALNADAAYAMAATKAAYFFCATDGVWHTILTA